MLASKAWVFSKLSGYAPLVSVLGSADKISDYRPEIVTEFPSVILTDESQLDFEFVDNHPTMSALTVKVDVFTKIGLKTTTEIGIPIADLFDSLTFHCATNGEVPDPVEGVRHRVMRFSRALFPSELS